MKWLHVIAFLLVLIGALNWGLIGLFNMNLVTTLVGSSPALEQAVYVLVGLSALYVGITHKGECKVCSKM